MAVKHRAFNADRFIDKFRGRECLLLNFARQWAGRLDLGPLGDAPDIDIFKDWLAAHQGRAWDEMVEVLYQVYDLCTERGHECLVQVCREAEGYNPDPTCELPVECLSLKLNTEREELFRRAYDRHAFQQADKFAIYRAPGAGEIGDPQASADGLAARLGEHFKADKNSDRVVVRHYRDASYANFIIYHEKRVKAELVIKATGNAPHVEPLVLRPAQQDFVSYHGASGQLEIESTYPRDEAAIRRHFADACFRDPELFEGEPASRRFDLSCLADPDFAMPVDGSDRASLTELHFHTLSSHELDDDSAAFVIRGKNVPRTLNSRDLCRAIDPGLIGRAVFKFYFDGSRRGRPVTISGKNKISFNRAAHQDDIFRYLRNWGIMA